MHAISTPSIHHWWWIQGVLPRWRSALLQPCQSRADCPTSATGWPSRHSSPRSLSITAPARCVSGRPQAAARPNDRHCPRCDAPRWRGAAGGRCQARWPRASPRPQTDRLLGRAPVIRAPRGAARANGRTARCGEPRGGPASASTRRRGRARRALGRATRSRRRSVLSVTARSPALCGSFPLRSVELCRKNTPDEPVAAGHAHGPRPPGMGWPRG